MRKTWARLVLIVAVVCAAGFGWIYHQRASTSSEWLAALDNQTSNSTNNSALADTSSTDGHSLQATNSSTSAGQTQSRLSNSAGTSRTLNTAQSQSNATTAHQTNTVGSDSASTAGTTTKSSSTERSTVGNSVSRTSENTTASNTASSTGTSTTSNSQANSTGANSTGTATTTQTTGAFTIIVSENHGQTVLNKKVVAIHQGENLMQYMQQNFTIETAYGGAFITAIDGIKSQWTGVPADQRKPVDWFLYINSQQAPVGAADIVPRKGDVDDWDYHSWNPSTGQG